MLLVDMKLPLNLKVKERAFSGFSFFFYSSYLSCLNKYTMLTFKFILLDSLNSSESGPVGFTLLHNPPRGATG